MSGAQVLPPAAAGRGVPEPRPSLPKGGCSPCPELLAEEEGGTARELQSRDEGVLGGCAVAEAIPRAFPAPGCGCHRGRGSSGRDGHGQWWGGAAHLRSHLHPRTHYAQPLALQGRCPSRRRSPGGSLELSPSVFSHSKQHWSL